MMEEYNENNEFDLKVRSILENGAEEVPAGLWSGVAKRLPAASGTASRRPVFVRVIRYSAVAVAAACLAVGVVFTARDKALLEKFNISSVGSILTDASSVSSSSVPSAAELPAMSGRVPSAVASPAAMTESPAANDEVAYEEESAVTEVSEKSTTEEAPAPAAASDSKPIENTVVKPLSDDFPADPDELKSNHRPTVSLGAFTNAASNGTSSKGGAAMMGKQSTSVGAETVRPSVAETSTPIFGIPVSAGLAVKINFTERWGLGIGVNYSYLSSRFDGVYLMEDGSTRNYSNIRKELHYIGIPVNAYFNMVRSDIVNFYTFAGGTIEKCVSDKYRMVSPESGTLIHKEKVPGLQYSAGLGLGVEFNLAPHFGLYIDPSVRYYFNSGQPTSIRTQQPFLAQLDLGFRVNF